MPIYASVFVAKYTSLVEYGAVDMLKITHTFIHIYIYIYI